MDIVFSKTSAPHEIRIPVSAGFAKAAAAYRTEFTASIDAVMTRHGVHRPAVVPHDCVCDLPGAATEIARMFRTLADRFPASRFALAQRFEWRHGEALTHVVTPRAL